MSSRRESRPEIPTAEWIVAAVGALLVLASIGFIVWEAATRGDRPPDVGVRVHGITKGHFGYVTEVEAENHGDHTAADLHIEALLLGGTDTVEKRNTTIDYLPPGSKRRAGLIFQHDPRSFRIDVRATGYQAP